MTERAYEVLTPVLINGKTRRKGDVVPHAEIMGREPHRLGSLLRLGHITEIKAAPPKAKPKSTTKKKTTTKKKEAD